MSQKEATEKIAADKEVFLNQAKMRVVVAVFILRECLTTGKGEVGMSLSK